MVREFKRSVYSVIAAAAAVALTGCAVLPHTYSSVPADNTYSENTYTASEAYEMEEVYEEAAYESPMEAGEVSMYAVADMAYEEPYYEPVEFNTEEYSYQEESGFVNTLSNPLSSFAADVDTASYANLRRQLTGDDYFYPDSIRIEELINYFHYDYPEPVGNEPFSVTYEIAPCPWNEETELLLIGLQAKKLDTREMPRSNLVFLIDVSGSMDDSKKLPLVQRSFMTLIENLGEEDVVSLVTYSGKEEVVLDGVSGADKNEIMTAVEDLVARGSTNGEDALITAYKIAEKNYIDGGINRIIMATDGDFNIGISDEGDLTRLVKEKAQSGIAISVLGYGMGNYKDNKLESIADNGNGNYAYIDSIDEARKVLVTEAGGTLFTVAKDVKIQVDFNPAYVKGYRLIGYENRKMTAEEFNDDKKDGGEIGAGHSVTALYEIIPTGSEYEITFAGSKYADGVAGIENGELLTVNIRYKDPDGDTSTLLSYPVSEEARVPEMSDNMSWAAGVAQVGMLLKDSEYAGSSDFDDIKERLKPIADDDFREEFIYLINRARNNKQ